MMKTCVLVHRRKVCNEVTYLGEVIQADFTADKAVQVGSAQWTTYAK